MWIVCSFDSRIDISQRIGAFKDQNLCLITSYIYVTLLTLLCQCDFMFIICSMPDLWSYQTTAQLKIVSTEISTTSSGQRQHWTKTLPNDEGSALWNIIRTAVFLFLFCFFSLFKSCNCKFRPWNDYIVLAETLCSHEKVNYVEPRQAPSWLPGISFQAAVCMTNYGTE